MTNHRTFRARPLRALAALAAALATVAVSLVVAAPPASASIDGPHCRHDRRFNACLSFDWLASDFHHKDAYAGIDVYMPEQSGRDIVACDADFRATLRGDDGKGVGKDDHNQVIRWLVLQPGSPSAESYGITANFIADYISDAELNEDDSSDDELYVRVSFYNCITGETEYFRTGHIVYSLWA